MNTIFQHTLRSAFTGLFAAAMIWMPAPAKASTQGASIRASQLFSTLSRQMALNVRPAYTYGLLRRGESVTIRTTLHAGNRYVIVAGGCEDAYDVDVQLFDAQGNLVARDSDTQPIAVVQATANYTGTAYVKITMYNSTYNGAHYVLQYAWY